MWTVRIKNPSVKKGISIKFILISHNRTAAEAMEVKEHTKLITHYSEKFPHNAP
jgi:hypothetical protein